MLFSVVIPVFNVETYLKECVDSVLRQTFTDFELILVDDGSKDKSGALCDEYAAKDERVRVVHKDNGGQSSARNRGVELARGIYVFFLDSDDMIADENAFEILKNAVSSGADIVAYRYNKWFSEQRSEPGVSLAGITTRDKTGVIEELVRRDAFYCSCWSKITRLALLKENRITFDESSKCEDMDWYFQVVEKAKSMELVDRALVNYRQRPGSVTKRSGEKGFTDNIAVIEKWEAIFQTSCDESRKRVMLSALAKLYCNLLVSFAANYRQFKKYGARIYPLKHLLRYDANPRAKAFHRLSTLVGIRVTCQVLRIAAKLR